MSRLFGIGFAILFLAIGGFYFFISPSYQKSFQARVEYFLGDYEKAYRYAKEAYEENRYNKMAFSVFVQSKIALKYQEYIKRGAEYLDKIDVISKKNVIAQDDKSRIKIMCEIVMAEYKNLQSSKLTDEDLKNSAKEINDKFSKIYSELF